MIDSSLMKARAVERSQLTEGSLSDCASIEGIDPFFLHDALLYRYEVDNPLDAGSTLVISGLLSTWSDTVELYFFDVTDFSSQAFSIASCFAVRELRISGNDHRVVHFDGEFEGQFFSFKFKRAAYKKYGLKVPVSREEIGW